MATRKEKRKVPTGKKDLGKHLKTITPIKPLSSVVVEEIRCSLKQLVAPWPATGRLCQRLEPTQRKAEMRERQIAVETRPWIFQVHVQCILAFPQAN